MTGSIFSQNKANQVSLLLPDGLQYKVIKQGTGAKPSASDIVTVDYAGSLINGNELDSSYKRGEPANFQ